MMEVMAFFAEKKDDTRAGETSSFHAKEVQTCLAVILEFMRNFLLFFKEAVFKKANKSDLHQTLLESHMELNVTLVSFSAWQ